MTLLRLFLTIRPTTKASTCSTRVTPASRFLATVDSSTSIWFAVMVPRLLSVATSSTCCPRPLIFFTKKHVVENARQLILLAGVADIEPGTSSSSLLRVPLEAVLSDTLAPTPLLCDASAHHFTVPDPLTAPSMDADHLLRHHGAWISSFTICATKQLRHATNPWPIRPRLSIVPLHLPRSND